MIRSIMLCVDFWYVSDFVVTDLWTYVVVLLLPSDCVFVFVFVVFSIFPSVVFSVKRFYD